MVSDDFFMARAIQLARHGRFTTRPNPVVGCVIVLNGEIVGEGWHEKAGGPHAEIVALKQAAARAKGATVYVTLEPCSHYGRTPPCADALIEVGVARVVAAMQDPNPQVAGAGLQRLRSAGIEVKTGIMEAEARALNPGFIQRMEQGRPYVRLKLAASLDGRTAMANGESKWITGEAARADVQKLRARSSAIVTGAGTVLADNPSLTVRTEMVSEQPLRVIVDSHLSTPPDAKIFSEPGSTLVVTASEDGEAADLLVNSGAEVLCLPSANHGVDLVALMNHLVILQCNDVMIEAGSTLSGSALACGIVDEVVVYLAPHLMGAEAKGMFKLPEITSIGDRIALDIYDVRAIGPDWRISARVKR